MTYVNVFLKEKGIPDDLKKKINIYLNYNWELKKEIKIEEEEVMDLVNKELRDKLTINLNGRILISIEVFEVFKLEFLSLLAFKME
jgi:hypothetical protein